jgi:hypothetical protein
MQTHYIQYGRRHKIPSTVEILDELRADYVPGYVRKSWAQFGFVRPHANNVGSTNAFDEICTPPLTRA